MKKFLSILLTVLIMAVTVLGIPSCADGITATIINNSGALMYTNAGTVGHAPNGETSQSMGITIPVGTEVTFLATKVDGDGDVWYKVRLADGTEGYVYSRRVNKPGYRYYSEDFETNLSYFPETYRDALRNLHNQFPNWKFIAEYTDCNFDEAVEKEYRSGESIRPRKYIEVSQINSLGIGWGDNRAYFEGAWENAEGSGRWTYASKMAIEHYMNPTNFLNNNDIFMFLNLANNSSGDSKNMLVSAVSGTFLNADVYIDAIMKAAESSQVSPVAIAALIIIEQGISGGGALATGSQGYYNFFNVGASGGSNEEIISSGLAYAQQHGWDTIEKSIVGGASFSTSSYIASGQDTYYYMDFNVAKGDYSHQYAASVYDAFNKGIRMASPCKSNNNASLEFIIPVFLKDLPNAPIYCPNKGIYIPTPPPVVIIKRGDINKDGIIDIIDAALLRKHILQISELNTSANPEADINADGIIDVIDAARLRKHILQIEPLG